MPRPAGAAPFEWAVFEASPIPALSVSVKGYGSCNVGYPRTRSSFVKARVRDWPSDPWVKASYSLPAPGQVTMGPLMAQPVGGRLHLAGEHTGYAFVGYMEEALQSGARGRRAHHVGGALDLLQPLPTLPPHRRA